MATLGTTLTLSPTFKTRSVSSIYQRLTISFYSPIYIGKLLIHKPLSLAFVILIIQMQVYYLHYNNHFHSVNIKTKIANYDAWLTILSLIVFACHKKISSYWHSANFSQHETMTDHTHETMALSDFLIHQSLIIRCNV